MYFFDSRSICASAPSSTSVAVPASLNQRYGVLGIDDDERDARITSEVARLHAAVGGVDGDAFVVDVDPDDGRLRRAVALQRGHDANERVLEERTLVGREVSHEMATMRSIAPRARSAISSGTVTTNFQSRSESRSFGSVIIFM